MPAAHVTGEQKIYRHILLVTRPQGIALAVMQPPGIISALFT